MHIIKRSEETYWDETEPGWLPGYVKHSDGSVAMKSDPKDPLEKKQLRIRRNNIFLNKWINSYKV